MAQPLRVARTTETATEKLWITVLFTNAERTRVALTSALKLAGDLNASLEIVVMRVVPYPLPLERPPVSSAFTENQVFELTRNLGVETAVRIYDCRDPETMLLDLLPPGSVVIVGWRKR